MSEPHPHILWEHQFVHDPHSACGTLFRWKKLSHAVDFEVYEAVTSAVDGQAPEFEIYGWQKSGDWTSDIEKACPQISGFIKWDQCSHVYFGNAEAPGKDPDGYLHLCGKPSWLWLHWVLERVWETAKEHLEKAGAWLEDKD